MKNKGKTNFIIDGIMFLIMAMIAGLAIRGREKSNQKQKLEDHE
jgi:hypothetical protein